MLHLAPLFYFTEKATKFQRQHGPVEQAKALVPAELS
jgi:hypothetical protein